MRIRILGDVTVEQSGSPIHLSRSMERSVLAVLALRANRVVRIDELILMLWDDNPPASALRTLRSHVSRLRRSLGETKIVTVAGGYMLEVEQEHVDVLRFEDLVNRAAGLPPDSARAHLIEALELWQGRPFGDLPDSHRAQAEATRLEEIRSGAEMELIDIRLEAGEHQALIGQLEVLTSQHPEREPLWQRLVLALHRADALRALQRLRTVLASRTGLEPGPDLVELERLVLADSPELDLAGLPDHTNREPHHDAPINRLFVGRDNALRQLDREWAKALCGASGVVAVRGDAGSGKTTLLAEFVGRCGPDALIAYGIADRDLRAPFLAVSDAVRELVSQITAGDHGEDNDHRIHSFDTIFSVGESQAHLDERPSGSSAELDQARLLAEADELVDRLSGQQPVLILLDDVQWIDRASAALVRRWARRQDRRLLVVLSCRRQEIDEPAERLIDDLTIAGPLTTVQLDGLTADDVALLLSDRPELDAVDLTRRTGGNPYLIHQLADSDDPASLPDGVTALVRARLRSFSPVTRQALETAAVAGGTIDVRVLAPVLNMATDEVILRLEPAVRAGLIDEDPDELGQYLFDHDLTAEALRSDISHNRSLLLHRQIAETMAENLHGPSDPMIFAVADHLRHGKADAAMQLDAFLAAGRLARRSLAFDDAGEWLEAALDLADIATEMSSDTQTELLLEVGRVRGIRRVSGARRLLLRAAESASEPKLVEVAIELTRFNHARSVSLADRQVLDVINSALATCGPDRIREKALLTASLAAELIWVVGVERRCELAEQSLEWARAFDDPVLMGQVILRTQLSASCPDNLQQRITDATEAVRQLEESDAPGRFEAIIASLIALATAKFEGGEVTEAASILARAQGMNLDVSHTAMSWRLTSLEIAIEIFRANYTRAEELLSGIAVNDTGTGSPHGLLVARGWSQVFIDRGDHGTLETVIERMTETAPELPGWGSAQAVVLCELGRHDEATHLLAATMSSPLFEERNLGWLTHRVADSMVARDLGDRHAMERLRSMLEPYSGRICIDIIASAGPVDLALGVLDGGLDNHTSALRYLEAAISCSALNRAPAWEARCELEMARILESIDRSVDAADAARRALRLSSEVGSRHVALAAENFLDC